MSSYKTPLPVSGTVTVTPSGTQTVAISQTGTNNDVDANITNASIPVTDNGGSLTVDGTIAISNFPVTQPVSGPLTDAQLRASVVPVSIPTPVPITDNSGSLTVDGTVAVSNFPASQAVTGTFWQATQPVSGTFFQTTQPISAASLPLPSGAATETTLADIEADLDQVVGTWAYYAGTLGTVNVTGGQRVLGISAHSTTGGTFTINGGNTITVPANVSINIAPIGNLTAPTVIFTGTDTYFIEVVS